MSEGLQGDLQHVADNLLTPLLKRMHPELEWRWEYGELDEARSVDIADKEVKTARTRNEIRVARGEEPMGFWLPPHEYKKLDPDDEKIEKFHKNPWNMPADQPIVGQMQQLQMMEQGEQQPEQPGGGFGGEGMGEGDEFPFGQPGPGQQFQPPGQDDDDEPLADETQTQQPGQKPEQQQQDEAQPMNKARGRVVVYVEEIRSA